MYWTVTYRKSNGDKCQISVTADDREACFAKCRELAIQPIHVETGNSGNTRQSEGRLSRKALLGSCLAGVLCLVIALICFTQLGDSSGKSPKPVEKRKSPETSNRVGTVTRTEGKTENVSAASRSEEVLHPRVSEPKVSAPTNFLSKLKRNRVGHPAITNVRKKVVFKTGLEQTLNWVFNTPLGNPPPILPSISPRDSERLVEILSSPNPLTEEDDEKSADQKKMVEAAKKEMQAFLKAGGKPADFLTYYHGELRKSFNERQDAQKLVIESLKENPEVGRALADEVNKRFEAKGIKPVFIPPKYRK